METNVLYIALLALLGGCAAYLTVLFKNGKKKQIFKIVKSLVDEAEFRFGSGTGKLKYDFVVGRLHSVLPGYVKLFISDELLDVWIETAVDELQEILEKMIKEEEAE